MWSSYIQIRTFDLMVGFMNSKFIMIY